jgi:tRNA(adenine34) deaminase
MKRDNYCGEPDLGGQSFMDIAFEEAKAAEARGEVPIGAVIAKNGKVLARAGNRTRQLNDPTAHAEILVIRQACSEAGSERLPGAELHVTLEPCAMCAAAISFARIKRLYFAAEDEKGGGVIHGARFFGLPTCHHVPEIYEGIGRERAVVMLKEFFGQKR